MLKKKKKDRFSLCSPDCPGTDSGPPVSSSHVLGLSVYATMYGL